MNQEAISMHKLLSVEAKNLGSHYDMIHNSFEILQQSQRFMELMPVFKQLDEFGVKLM
jgi:hypothetical protein